MRIQQAGQAAAGVLAGVLLAVAGCTPYPKTQPIPQDQLLGRYNDNAQRITALWARANVVADVGDTQGHRGRWGSMLGSPNSILAAQKGEGGPAPAFVLIGREAGVDIFRAGIDPPAGVYYFWYKFGDRSGGWGGSLAQANQPHAAEVPANPVQMVSLLGMLPLGQQGQTVEMEVTRPGKSVWSGGKQRYAYVVKVFEPAAQGAKPVLQREVYFTYSDTEPPQPFRVDMFDPQGLLRTRADLGDYRGVQMAGGQAQVPSRITIAWPRIANLQAGNQLDLALSELQNRELSPKVFDFRANLPEGLAVRDVDQPQARPQEVSAQK